MLFLNIQVLHSIITIRDHIVMRYACIVLTTILLLLLDLVIVLGDEAFATIEIPNMTLTEPPSGFTPVQNVSTPTSLEQLAMSGPPSNISQPLTQPLPPPSNISQPLQDLNNHYHRHLIFHNHCSNNNNHYHRHLIFHNNAAATTITTAI